MNETNHQDWLNKGPWYNTPICSKLHGSRFEDFITQAKTDRYNLMCSLVPRDILKLYYKDDDISIGDRAIPDDATIKTLEHQMPLLMLLIYGLHCFVKSLTLDVRHISRL